MKIKTVSTTQKSRWISKPCLSNTSLSRAIKCQFTCFKFTFVTLLTIHKKCWNTGNIHSKHMLVALTALSTAIKAVKSANALLNDYRETLIFSHKWFLSSYLIICVPEQKCVLFKASDWSEWFTSRTTRNLTWQLLHAVLFYIQQN